MLGSGARRGLVGVERRGRDGMFLHQVGLYRWDDTGVEHYCFRGTLFSGMKPDIEDIDMPLIHCPSRSQQVTQVKDVPSI
jgi:hypothetical protein